MATVDFISAPDVTVEAQTRVSVQLGDFRQAYRLWETNAPQRYDYADTLHLYGTPDTNGLVTRFVLIPDDAARADEQTIRYRTGLYAAARAEFFSHADVTTMLVKAALDHLRGGR